MTNPATDSGTPNSTIFSSARGSAASEEAVENASRNGSRIFRKNSSMGARAIISAGMSTSSVNRTSAPYSEATSFA